MLNFNNQQKGKGLKIPTPKQMPQRLPIALTEVKAGNTSENLLNAIIYSSLQAKEIINKVLNNKMSSVKI